MLIFFEGKILFPFFAGREIEKFDEELRCFGERRKGYAERVVQLE
jgi:hypothetical protein